MASSTDTILLIEDDYDYAALIRAYLLQPFTGPKYNVIHATHLATGIEQARNVAIDLILLDLILPDESNPLATFQAARDASAPVPIVVLSSVDDTEIITQLLAEGACSYLVKPHSNRELILRTIRYALDMHQMQKELSELRYRLTPAMAALDGAVQNSHQHARSLLHYNGNELAPELENRVTQLIESIRGIQTQVNALKQYL